MIAAAVLAGVGWTGLFIVLRFTLPTLGPRWFFFFLCTLAATGTSIPFLWFLHRRFKAGAATAASTLLRRALWIGAYAALCIWLQINRSLSLALALLLAVGFASIEWMLRLLEHSRWRPSR
jgi:hypothetical protein